jgi:O-antigen ligase
LSQAPAFERSTQYRLTCGALLLWWIASFYPVLTLGDAAEALASASESTANGSLPTQLLVISFAALGALYLAPAYQALRTRIQGRTAILLLSAYFLWAGASILWSIDRALTFRRVCETALVFIGAIGLGAGFYARTRENCLTLARHVLYANIVCGIILVGVYGPKGYFADLLNPDWTLKGDTMVAYFVYPAAYGILSALVLFSSSRFKRMWIVALLGLVLLIMKSRTALVGVVAVALLIYSRLAEKGLLRSLASVCAVALLLVQVDLATGGHLMLSGITMLADSFSSALPYLSIGNGIEDLLSLDGRVPLWKALWPMYQQHALLGHGFGAFWNPARFDMILSEVQWPAVVAHNGFLDELLGTGIIGLSLFLAFLGSGIRSSLRHTRTDRRAGYLVLGWLLLFLMSNTTGSIMQAYFQYPTLFAVTALFALLAHRPTYAVQRRRAMPSREQEV